MSRVLEFPLHRVRPSAQTEKPLSVNPSATEEVFSDALAVRAHLLTRQVAAGVLEPALAALLLAAYGQGAIKVVRAFNPLAGYPTASRLDAAIKALDERWFDHAPRHVHMVREEGLRRVYETLHPSKKVVPFVAAQHRMSVGRGVLPSVSMLGSEVRAVGVEQKEEFQGSMRLKVEQGRLDKGMAKAMVDAHDQGVDVAVEAALESALSAV